MSSKAIVWGMCVMAAATAGLGGEARTPLQIGDKTLVVWATVGDLRQRGGSALTIENGDDRFDAIVFGELAPGKWMAGSSFFARTEKQQDTYPAETADPTALVQLAIVYEGKQVTLYRNGAKYAAYAIGQPQEFGPRASPCSACATWRRATAPASPAPSRTPASTAWPSPPSRSPR